MRLQIPGTFGNGISSYLYYSSDPFVNLPNLPTCTSNGVRRFQLILGTMHTMHSLQRLNCTVIISINSFKQTLFWLWCFRFVVSMYTYIFVSARCNNNDLSYDWISLQWLILVLLVVSIKVRIASRRDRQQGFTTKN